MQTEEEGELYSVLEANGNSKENLPLNYLNISNVNILIIYKNQKKF